MALGLQAEKMKAFITKYALTSGIQEVGGCQKYYSEPKMISFKNGFCTNYFHKPYWHESIDEAKKHADKMRIKKIESLEKQLAKLRSLKFE